MGINYFKIFLIAFSIRLIAYLLILYFNLPTGLTIQETEDYLQSKNPKVQLADASDYSLTVQNGMIPPKVIQDYWGYSFWWQRNPLHTLILYLTGNSIMFQMFLSALSVMLLFYLNKTAGILLMLYPQNIIYSFLTTKINIMLFSVVVAMVIFRDRKFYLFLSVVIITALFTSYFNYVPHTAGIMEEFNTPLWQKWWGVFRPTFNHTHIVLGTNLIQYIQMPFYIAFVIYYIRNVKWNNFTILILLLISIGAMIEYGHEFHREYLFGLFLNFKSYQ